MNNFKKSLLLICCFTYHAIKADANETLSQNTEELIDFLQAQTLKNNDAEVSMSLEKIEKTEALHRQNVVLENDIKSRQSRIKKLKDSQNSKQDFTSQIKANQKSISTSRDQIALNNKKIDEIKSSN